MPGKRTEIMRLKRGLCETGRACSVVYAAGVCRRTVTARWDDATDSIVFEVMVPVPKRIVAAAKTGGSDAR